MHKILMVGENAELRNHLRTAVALQDCVIETARTEKAALRRLRCTAFDLLLTAPATPLDHDLELLEELRAVQPGLKIIILAAAATPDDVIAAMRAHVFACFTTPYNAVEVVEMVEKALTPEASEDGIQVLSANDDWISLRVASRRLTAERLVRFMTELRTDVPNEMRADLLTAFREMLLNAMEHGAGFDPDKVVEVAAVRTERAIVYYFRDPGPGFARAALPQAAAPTTEDPLAHLEYRAAHGLRPGGFGILMTSQLVDELIYNQFGNEVLLIKHTA